MSVNGCGTKNHQAQAAATKTATKPSIKLPKNIHKNTVGQNKNQDDGLMLSQSDYWIAATASGKNIAIKNERVNLSAVMVLMSSLNSTEAKPSSLIAIRALM